MRITNSMIVQNQLSTIQTNLAAVNTSQQQLSSGLRFQRAADDPQAAVQVMSTASQLDAITQYSKNVSLATSQNSAEDTALSQITDLMTRAKELAIGAASPQASSSTIVAAQSEVDQILNQVVSIASQKFGDGYLFGGDQSTTQPFSVTGSGATVDYTTSGASGSPSIEIGPGQVMQPVHDGTQVFVGTGILDSLKQLDQALASTGGDVNGAMDSLDSSFDNLQSLVGDVGARGNRLQVASSNLDALKTNLTTFQSSVQDVDVAAATTDLAQRQTAYQAALLATSKVMGMSLANYLTTT